MKHVTFTAVVFLLAIIQGSADFQCPSATFVELGKDVLIDCLITDVNDIYWLRGTEEDHYPIVKIEMGLKTISKVAQDHFDITDTGALVIRNATNDLTGSYVMLHYRTNHVKEVDTVTLNVTKLIDSIITQGPSGGVYPLGSTITLSCTFQKGYVVGWKEFENKDIFVADTKVTANTKYDNFRVSLSEGISSLLIIGADLEDAGVYSCNTKSYAHVEIEVPPSLSIMFNVTDDDGTDSTESHGVIDITCNARNAKPAVMIRFKTDGNEWINPSETWTVPKGVTFDTSATLKYSFRKNQTDVLLTCQTFGQTRVSAMETTIHLYLPICNITISGNEVRCTCQANPPVDKYRMELNGNLQDGDVLYIEESNSANVTCFGTNGIGTGLSSILFHGNKAGFGIFSIVVTISVGVVLIVLAVIYTKCRLSSRRGKSGGELPNEEENNELLPSLGAISHKKTLTKSVEGNPEELGITENIPMNVSDSHFSATVSPNETSGPNKEIFQAVKQLSSRIICDWEIFAVEDLKIEKEDVKILIQYLTVTPSGVLVQDCVKFAIFKWMAKKDAQDINQLLTHTIISSKVCKDFLCNYCVIYFQQIPGYTIPENECNGRRNKEQDKIVLSDKRQPASFATILRWIANLVGKVGSEYLMRSYRRTLENLKVTNGSTPCHELFEQLVEKKLLSNETSSLQSLCEHLRNCYLFSAERITLLYIERIMPSQNLLRTIEIITPFDWDLFAKEKLKLTEDVIESAIKCYSGVEDQFEAVLCQFLYTSETNQCVAHLENILSESIQEYNGCYSYKSFVSSQHAFLKHGEHKEETVSAVKHELAGTTGDTAPDIDLGIQQDQTSEHTEPMETSEWNKRFEKMYEKVELEDMKVNCGNSSFTADKNKQELVIGVLNSLERVSTGLKKDIERYIDWLAEECGKHMTLLCCVRLLSILENSMDVAKSKNPGGDVLKVAISLPNSRKIFQHFGLLIDEKLEFLLRLNENVGHITGSKPRVKENLHQTEIRCPDCGVSLYQLMLDQLGDILGTVGSERIAKAYNLSESMIEMINTSGHPGHLLVPELIRTGHEIQSKESLQNLEFYLQQTGLFRASYIIRDFMRKQRPSTFNVDNKDQVTQV
ncbi:uncharacterized protein [Apostichopus japonicus]|uniref:uncharacterized protein isoform X2 n=1 Tax=Stichopus japonicus TaxID=307972 RepID=UPI003AB3DA6A